MARKVQYSTPLKYFWDNLYRTQKKFTPEFTDDQIFEVLRNNIINSPLAPSETQASKQLIVSGWEMWRLDSKGELLHVFFVDKYLRDFLETTTLSDLHGIKKFLYEIINNRLKYSENFLEKYQNIEMILGKSNYESFNQMAIKIRDRERILYFGHDTIMRLCSGDIAHILDLIKRIFDLVGGSDIFNNPELDLPIDPIKQNKAVKEMGSDYLNKIENIPNHGKHLREIAEAFGNVAHWFLLNRNSKNEGQFPPWQAYRIEIRNSAYLDGESQDIYNNLLRYSIFIKDSRGKSIRGVVAPRLYLRRLLIPVFLLTPSKRDNIGLNGDEFINLLNNPKDFEKTMKRKKPKRKLKQPDDEQQRL